MARLTTCSPQYNLRFLLGCDYQAIGICKFQQTRNHYNFSTHSAQNEILKKECCKVLGLKQKYSALELKDSFLRLAKRYHPDSGSEQADNAKFTDVESAYRYLKSLDETQSNLFDDVEQTLENDFGIKHKVPQHRQYLTFGGVGSGSPSQRERTYQLSRVDQALDNVYEHKVKTASSSAESQLIKADAALARQSKSTQAIERLVEDLIQASIARGEFDNLPASGKPLKAFSENPYVDATTHKLNQILISNGFSPEWILLQKEIKEDRLFFKDVLRKRRAVLGKVPVNEDKAAEWLSTLTDLKKEVTKLNQRINKFNIIVPLPEKQQIHFLLESEARKILMEDPLTIPEKKPQAESHSYENKNSKDFLSVIWSFLNPQKG